MPYFIGIDVGTTGSKVLLIDEYGKVVDKETVEYPLYTPRPGWSEQNPEDWWIATKEAVKNVLSRSKADPSSVEGIGLTGQMHGLVILDRNDEVIRPAILWNDQRTAEEADNLNKIFGEKVIEITGSIVHTGFTAPKILWVKNNEPSNFEKISKLFRVIGLILLPVCWHFISARRYYGMHPIIIATFMVQPLALGFISFGHFIKCS